MQRDNDYARVIVAFQRVISKARNKWFYSLKAPKFIKKARIIDAYEKRVSIIHTRLL